MCLILISLKEALSASIPGGKDMGIAFDQVRTGQMRFSDVTQNPHGL